MSMTSVPSLSLSALPNDVILGVLSRLEPDDPAWLLPASLVCKHWRSNLTDAGFLRRYCESRRTLPRLGLIHNQQIDVDIHIARFIATYSFRPASASRRGRCIAVRHGRILLEIAGCTVQLFVWDPITDETWALPPTPTNLFNAMVLCATPGCDHLDCHGRPFAVALVGPKETRAYLYLSETGEWSEQAQLEDFFFVRDHQMSSVLVGDVLYFTCVPAVINDVPTSKIVKYHMGRRELSLIDSPPLHDVPRWWEGDGSKLTATHDGQLRLVEVDGSTLRLWSQEADGWTVRRVVEPEPAPEQLHVKGFAPCAGEIYVDARGVLYSVELESGRASKPEKPLPSLAGPLNNFTTYESFYTLLTWV